MTDGTGAMTFDLGDFPLRSGEVLRAAKLVYATHGTLNAARDNVIVFPTAYGGTHEDNLYLIGEGKALDPKRYFIICPNLFGASLSTSPSNAAPGQTGAAFPYVSIEDNIEAQKRLVFGHFGVSKIQLVVGFSMGGQQAFQWAVSARDQVERCAPICGSARTAEHNIVFLDGIEATLLGAGKAAVGRVWAGWGLSQTFYREERWRLLGFESRDAFVAERYVASFEESDAHDLHAMLKTWRGANVGDTEPFGGDAGAALASIRALTMVMPSRTDLYFPPEDSMREITHLVNGELVVIESIYGHSAGGGGNEADTAFIDAHLKRLLADR
jgi:homoserine O-acetyltransferase